MYAFLQAYEEIIRAGHAFEIVFVSSDIDQSEYDSNTRDMTWAKLPYQDPLDAKYANSTSQQLTSKFSVKFLPFLVVLDAAGKNASQFNASQVLKRSLQVKPSPPTGVLTSGRIPS